MPTKSFHAMGSHMTAILDSVDPAHTTGLSLVPQWFEEWEAALSRFRPGSELNRIQTSVGKEYKVSSTLYSVIADALNAADATDGLVTPLILDALCAAGYDQSLESLEDDRQPDALRGKSIPDWHTIRLNPTRHSIRLPQGARLDLGGIAKGWAADRVAALLKRTGPALMDAGGDISVSGPRADGSPWPVGVFNPFGGPEPLCTLALSGGGVATSGRDYRKWSRNGVPRHHIIDPRTGESARTDVFTATVIAPTARRAEAAAKAALILGSAHGLAWLDSRPDLAGMLVLEDRRIVYSRVFPGFLWN